MAESSGPLSGYRILDLSSVIMGPYATQILADLGADVIVVESATGDTNRIMSAGAVAGLGGIALNISRNKRNVALDLKEPQAREAVLRLAATCDAVVTNLRPKSLRSLRLTYADIAEVRPDIVYCQAAGFASDSPRADDPAYDDVIQAASGVADLFGRVMGRPGLAPTIMADKVCGLTIVYAVLAALLQRERDGRGQQIEVPMVETMSAFMLVEHGADAVSAGGAPGYKRILTPNRRPQETADGWIHILPYTSAHYETIFSVGGRDDLAGDPRYADLRACIVNSDFLYEAVQSVTPLFTTAEWLQVCERNGIPSTPVTTLEELVDRLPVAEHPVAGPYRSIPAPVRFSSGPTTIRRHAPLPGEHTREVLTEIGLDPAVVDRIAGPAADPEPIDIPISTRADATAAVLTKEH
ncbi:CaiB/BaiF CoA transferase family protein [Pseudonocardia sp. CA-107938]|uniref:CaiB/BaiF CoA transferase family protein n=1 Tax=Pseudonocardia sp. CA-107938 TaxID=3240021 RepID=UPI003D909AC5